VPCGSPLAAPSTRNRECRLSSARTTFTVSFGQRERMRLRKEERTRGSGNPCCSKYCRGNEKAWSKPTSVNGASDRFSTSHVAIPFRVQDFRRLGIGWTPCGTVKRSAVKTRSPLRLRRWLLSARVVDANIPFERGFHRSSITTSWISVSLILYHSCAEIGELVTHISVPEFPMIRELLPLLRKYLCLDD
jgi:hypothetical protein